MQTRNSTLVRPTGIRAPHGARVFEVSWPDGSKDLLPHEILRGYCPCAGCQGHSGRVAYQGGHNLDIRSVEPIGNYALGLTWGDGHSSGIYSFEYLMRLGRLLARHGKEGLIGLGELPSPGNDGAD